MKTNALKGWKNKNNYFMVPILSCIGLGLNTKPFFPGLMTLPFETSHLFDELNFIVFINETLNET